jgi:hypothetical protein
MEILGMVFGIMGFGIGLTGLSFGVIAFSRINGLEAKLKESGALNEESNPEQKV